MNIQQYDCIVFDMDGTLAISKGPITSGMASALNTLLQKKKVAVISGGRFEQFEKQLISYLDPAGYPNLFILPTTGTALYHFDGTSWKKEFDESLSEEERSKIKATLMATLIDAGYREETTFGEIIEDRGSQITFSGLGNSASPSVKASWDPDMEKRKRIIELLTPRLLEYTLTIGGMTSIDITKQGEDKAYGLKRFSETAQIPLEKILFIGDKLEPGGNDYPVKSTGVATVAVLDPLETQTLIEGWFI